MREPDRCLQTRTTRAIEKRTTITRATTACGGILWVRSSNSVTALPRAEFPYFGGSGFGGGEGGAFGSSLRGQGGRNSVSSLYHHPLSNARAPSSGAGR